MSIKTAGLERTHTGRPGRAEEQYCDPWQEKKQNKIGGVYITANVPQTWVNDHFGLN